MDCEETGLETIDYGTYAATLTATSNSTSTNDDNTLATILRNMGLPEDQLQAILAANRSNNIGNHEHMSGINNEHETGKNETRQKYSDDDDKTIKLANISPTKYMKPKGKTLTSNSFTITKRETRSMKRAGKSKIPEIAKITPHSKKQPTNDTISVDVMDSDDISNVLDTLLTLKHNISDDVIFSNTKDTIFGNSEGVIFMNSNDTTNDVIFNNAKIDDVSFGNNDDYFEDATAKPNRIIPSLKTRLATGTPLKDSSLQQATQVIKSNHQVPVFTSQLDEHDTQGWEQVECPKRRKSDKIRNLQTIETKLAVAQITAQAKEASFKALLEEIDNDELMEADATNDDADGNEANDADDDVDAGMDTEDTNNDDNEPVDETEVGDIEFFPDDCLRATHSYKNDFPDKKANEYEVTK